MDERMCAKKGETCTLTHIHRGKEYLYKNLESDVPSGYLDCKTKQKQNEFKNNEVVETFGVENFRIGKTFANATGQN